jgi:hypothetical protein
VVFFIGASNGTVAHKRPKLLSSGSEDLVDRGVGGENITLRVVEVLGKAVLAVPHWA